MAGIIAGTRPHLGIFVKLSPGSQSARYMACPPSTVEEADESIFRLDLVMDGELPPRRKVEPSHREADELTAIFTAALNTARRNKKPAP